MIVPLPELMVTGLDAVVQFPVVPVAVLGSVPVMRKFVAASGLVTDAGAW